MIGRKSVRTELESIKAYHDPNYTPTDSTDSLPAWKLCRSWIDNCIENHDRCKGPHPGAWWPTRLLYIGRPSDGDLSDGDLSDKGLSSLNIQLHETLDKPPKGSYMTLSHCWGASEEMLKLTMDTYEYRIQNGFSYTELPKTFQDVVRLSRFLRNEYIWIDSLCIIQKSKNDKDDKDARDDWERESKTMGNIYRYSKCNIAATASRGPSEGCFYSRSPTVVPPLEIMFRTGEEENSSEKRYLFFEENIWDNIVEDAPLNKRSWVMQERALAPRQIHCGREQLLWECKQTTACETFPFVFEFEKELRFWTKPATVNLTSITLTLSEINTLRFYETEDNWLRNIHVSSYEDEDESENEERLSRFEQSIANLQWRRPTQDKWMANMRRNIYEDWTDIVSRYSSCALTHRTDKLIAILGIASRIQDVLKDDKYVAGLWRSQLHWQLLWGASWNDDVSHDMAPSYDIGPSWSWASLSTRVDWEIPKIDRRYKLTKMMDILEVHDGHTITGQGTAGEIRESPLKLRCILYKIHAFKGDDAWLIESDGLSVAIREEHVHMDNKESRKFWEQAYIMPVSKYASHALQHVRGLVVSPCQERLGFYRRIAVWSVEIFRVNRFDRVDRVDIGEHIRSMTDKDKVTITLI